jgi:hypothetical protein
LMIVDACVFVRMSLNSLDTTIFWENFLQYVDEFCNLIGREASLYVKLSLI